MKSGADNPLFYQLIEQIDPSKIYCNKEIVCNYNDMNPLNDYKIRGEEQNRNASLSYIQYKFSVVVLVSSWDQKQQLFAFINQLVDSVIVDEIIVVNSSRTYTPSDAILKHPKIHHLIAAKGVDHDSLLNMGVSGAKNKNICVTDVNGLFDITLLDCGRINYIKTDAISYPALINRENWIATQIRKTGD
jgi:hypothetical protein